MRALDVKPAVHLIPLGTGGGLTTVYHGEPSSAFAIRVGERHPLLVDLGYGVARQALLHCGAIPRNVFITHNHSDHSGELPVVALKSAAEGTRLRIFCAPEVAERLREQRFHEFRESGVLADDLAEWIETPVGTRTAVDEDLSLTPHRGLHSEASFGFVLYYHHEPVLGYSADSGFDREFYRRLCEAPVVLLDGRAKGSREHADFEEILEFERSVSRRIYITHYGRAADAPLLGAPLRVGEPVLFWAEGQPPTPPGSAALSSAGRS